jgi:hypothetical protein
VSRRYACRLGLHRYEWCVAEIGEDAPFRFRVYECAHCGKPGAPSKTQQALIMNRMLNDWAEAELRAAQQEERTNG